MKYTICAVAIFLLGGCSTLANDPFCRGDSMCNLAMKNNRHEGRGPVNPFDGAKQVIEYQWGVATGRTYK